MCFSARLAGPAGSNYSGVGTAEVEPAHIVAVSQLQAECTPYGMSHIVHRDDLCKSNDIATYMVCISNIVGSVIAGTLLLIGQLNGLLVGSAAICSHKPE